MDIQKRTCENCEHSREPETLGAQMPDHAQLLCCAHPPQIFPFAVRNQMTNQSQMGFQTASPSVPKDHKCGEWSPRTVQGDEQKLN